MSHITPLQAFSLSATVLTALFLSTMSQTNAQVYRITLEECRAQGNKVTVCHATSSTTNPYVEETIACEAAFSQTGHSGHFDEQGNPVSGHEDDLIVQPGGHCPTATTSAESTPLPIPSSSPTASPLPSSDPSPTPVVIASTSGSSGSQSNSSSNSSTAQTGRHTSLSNDNLSCSSGEAKTFDVVMDVTDNGQPVKGVAVHFTYNGIRKDAWTFDGGRARVTFDRQTDGIVTASAEGYPTQTMFVTVSTCATVAPKTLANTGSSENTIPAGLILLGLSLISGAGYAYKKQ